MSDVDRKDRLVQTRVPGDLDEALREQAKKKRVSVSQLIRNVLEDTFDLVDNVVGEAVTLGKNVSRDAKRIAESAQGRRNQAGVNKAVRAIETVYAWQKVVLNRDGVCEICGASLRKGGDGMVGLNEDRDAPPVWLCVDCASGR
jgi:hypothetical protein